MAVVGVAIKAVGAWATATKLGAIATNLLISASLTAVQSALQRNAMKRQPLPGIQTEFTTDGGIRPQAFIVGRYATGGHMICPPMSHGKVGRNPNGFLTYVIALSDVPGASLRKVIVNDTEVTFAAAPENMPIGGKIPRDRSAQWYSDNGLDPVNPETGVPLIPVGRPATGDHAGNCWLIYYNGRQTAADPYLLQAYGPGTPWAQETERPWTTDMVGIGTCYAILTFKLNNDLWNGMPRCRFELDGIPLYDPRRDSTRGGNGPQRATDPATWEPSDNAKVIEFNILRGIPIAGGPVWGYGVGDEALPLADWIPVMNAADAQIDDAPAWRAGLEIGVDQEPAAILDEIMKVSHSSVAEVGGVWKSAIGAGGAPVWHFTDQDVLISSPAYATPFPGLQQTYNGVHASYPEPDALWQSKDAPPRYNSAWEAADNGRRLIAELALPACPYDGQVQRIMQSYIEEERRFRSHIVALPPEAEILEPLDIVSWTSAEHGYEAKRFRVTETAQDLLTGEVTVALRERDPNDYSWRPDFRLPSAVAPVLTPPPPVIVPESVSIEGIVIADDQGRPRRAGARIRWAGWALDGITGVRWEIRQGSEVLSGTMHDPERGEFVVPDLLPATPGSGRIRFIGARSGWTVWIPFATPDVRLGSLDLEFEQITQEVLAALPEYEGWITSADVESLVEQARSDARTAIDEVADLARDNLAIARNYTDTGVQQVVTTLETEIEQMSARIAEITAANTSGNLIANPSFVAGLTDWTIGTASVTDEKATLTSELGQIVTMAGGFPTGNLLQWRVEHQGGAGVVRVQFLDAAAANLGSEFATNLGASATVRVASGQHTPPPDALGFRFRVTTTASVTIDNASATTIDQDVVARLSALEAAKTSLTESLALFQQTVNARFVQSEAAISNEAVTRAGADDALSGQINSVSAVANARNRTFRQATAPTGVVAGDIWYDTNANSRPKRWSGSAWVDAADTRIAQNAAAITAEQTARADADNALADSLTTVTARTNRGTATGRLRVTSQSGPTDVQNRIGLHSEVSDGEATHSAAIFLDARSDGTSQIVAIANRFAIVTGTGVTAAKIVPFVVQGGIAYFDTAHIRTGTILAGHIGHLEVDTFHVKDRAMTSGHTFLNSNTVSFSNLWTGEWRYGPDLASFNFGAHAAGENIVIGTDGTGVIDIGGGVAGRHAYCRIEIWLNSNKLLECGTFERYRRAGGESGGVAAIDTSGRWHGTAIGVSRAGSNNVRIRCAWRQGNYDTPTATWASAGQHWVLEQKK
ncbi:MAG: phage tail protein [Paracoccus sp. (in: a-proteobacteria)]|nr:phage tail protein [Paracoccus sp. (in: a-proteobacteria)]